MKRLTGEMGVAARTKLWTQLACLLAFCLALPTWAAPNPGKVDSLPLAENSKALQPIVIAAAASDQTKAIAQELQKYLNQISGAEFKIETGDGKSGIVLGTLKQFPHPELEKPLAMRGPYDGREAFTIRTEKDRVLLLGRTELGASHAAYRFLETLGVRWFFPAKEWEVVPNKSSLRYSVNETERPKILSRRMFINFGMPDSHGVFTNPKGGQDFETWKKHNRQAQSINADVGHIWGVIATQNKEAFEKHPEYWALIENDKGEMVRSGPKFELANPAVRKMIVDFALQQLEDDPEKDVANIDPSDGGGWSQSKESLALGGISDQLFGVANEAARAVQKKFPGKMVGLLAYNYQIDPPSFPLEPNVYVELTAGFINGKLTYDQLLQEWPQKSKNMGYYEYFSFWPWDQDRFPGGKANDLQYLQDRIRGYARRNAIALTAESAYNWGIHGRGYYLANKLMWNPDADVPAILDDFYDKAFGPAAAPMKRYYERMDAGINPLITDNLLAHAYRDMEEASRLAKADPAVLARLDHLKQYLHYNFLRRQLDKFDPRVEADKARRKELTLETLTFLYRTRWSYMNHWAAAFSVWSIDAAKEFDEPTWSQQYEMVAPAERDAHRQPWRIEVAWTREQTEKDFQEELNLLQPQEIEEKSFSDDLVAVAFEDEKPKAGKHNFMTPTRYIFYSDGSPFKISVLPGFIAHNRNRPAPPYQVFDAKGKVVASGPLPLDGQTRELEIKLPGAGRYTWSYGTGAGQTVQVAAGQHATLVIEPYSMNHLGAMSRAYFYVPKGAKNVYFYWEGTPNAQQIFDPEGKLALEFQAYREIVTLPIPPGQDGKVWSFGGPYFGVFLLRFYNVPNYLASTPSDLMVPRELAKKDELTILP